MLIKPLQCILTHLTSHHTLSRYVIDCVDNYLVAMRTELTPMARKNSSLAVRNFKLAPIVDS